MINEYLYILSAYNLNFLLLLSVLLIFCLIITGKNLLVIGGLIREKDESGSLNAGSGLTGKRIPLIGFTFRYGSNTLQGILESMPSRSIELLKQWFRMDFWFMVFLYPTLFCAYLWLSHNVFINFNKFFSLVRDIAKWMPCLILLLDFLENIFALRIITGKTKNAFPMKMFSILKWLVALIYIISIALSFLGIYWPKYCN